MSEENVNVVKAFIDAGTREDWTRVAELVDPDVELHGTVGGVEEGQVYRGLADAMREYIEVDGEAWEERRIEPKEFLDADDEVVVLLHEYRRGRGSGVELENDTAVVFTVRDGRVVRMQGYMDPAAAQKATGLS
jgi:ketosteroid isomerase-like protein